LLFAVETDEQLRQLLAISDSGNAVRDGAGRVSEAAAR
jgi:hypothetical protein